MYVREFRLQLNGILSTIHYSDVSYLSDDHTLTKILTKYGCGESNFYYIISKLFSAAVKFSRCLFIAQ
jgi:hypothetical protein